MFGAKIKIDKNDKLFSIMIRERDGNKCVFCGRSSENYSIQNSHFWCRGHKATRFSTANCDALCFMCHNNNESNKQGFYRTWKLKQLGEEKYNQLEQLHNSIKKYGKFEKDILYKILKSQYDNKEHLKPNWTVEW